MLPPDPRNRTYGCFVPTRRYGLRTANYLLIFYMDASLRVDVSTQQTQNLNVTFPESPLKVSSLWTYFGHFGDVRINHVKTVLSHNVL